MTKKDIVRKVLAELKAKGLLNEGAIKKHIAKKSLKEEEGLSKYYTIFIHKESDFTADGKVGIGELITTNSKMLSHFLELKEKGLSRELNMRVIDDKFQHIENGSDDIIIAKGKISREAAIKMLQDILYIP